MKSIVFFFLLLLFAVATSENILNGWYNLTGVHEDEVIWGSLAPMMKKNTLTYPVLKKNRPFCDSSRGSCTGIANAAYSKCTPYHRCKRGITGP
ncbi:Rapid ALkalinization Factor [Arabidopsis thaliana x Arabidopsis arenosa]|uniref:Rapid ALkalinization Factor n=1 Tax=Arabidopsis thaliana x Arabidopsis arenosa TaxID=1240361 RepID=A0A8T1YD52_9BRAS|nr:Rapid ALkalinization Factor [Arabidopsis thaliana x Arabidopsis arenosa]